MSNPSTENHVFTLQKKGNKTVRMTFTQAALTLEDNYNKRWEIVAFVIQLLNGVLFIVRGFLDSNALFLAFGGFVTLFLPITFYRSIRFVDDREIAFQEIDRISVKSFWSWSMPLRIHLKNGKVRPFVAPFNSVDLARFKRSPVQFGVVVDEKR